MRSIATTPPGTRRRLYLMRHGSVSYFTPEGKPLPPETVPLSSAERHATALTLQGHTIGLSVSHEAGLTLAAIHRRGPIGIDVMRIQALSDWEPVAVNYLGRHAHQRILAMPALHRPLAFGREWTRVEASLKCLGLGLVEWTNLLDQQINRCETIELALPDGLTGTVAISV